MSDQDNGNSVKNVKDESPFKYVVIGAGIVTFGIMIFCGMDKGSQHNSWGRKTRWF